MADFDDALARDDSLLSEAFDWVIRLKSGEARVDDAKALARWRAKSPKHDMSFVRAVRLSDALGQAGKELLAEHPAEAKVVPFQPKRERVWGRRAFIGGALAASTIGVLMVRPPMKLWPSVKELAADFRTAPGEQRNIPLPDGSSIGLNTRTSISVRSGAEGQEVELISGEAMVAAEDRPVAVLAAGGRSEGRLARFNIRYLETAVCVTCLSGNVDIAVRDDRVKLTPRQQVTYSKDRIAPPVSIDPTAVTAWRNRLLIFKKEPLSRVVEEVNRYRKGRIILTNADLEDLLVNGVFHIDRLDGVIAQIRALGAEITELPGGVVLLS